jgi:hypothetical protein
METSNEKMADLAEYAGHGPISGLLTAFRTFPGTRFSGGRMRLSLLTTEGIGVIFCKN